MSKLETQSVGWGRAAVSRFAKSQDEIKADIMKALEGKLSVEFQDYSQWQRTSVGESSSPDPSTKVSLKLSKTRTSASTSRPLTGVSETTCSSFCIHPWNKKEPPIDHTAEILKNQRITVLKAQIAARKQSVREYRTLGKNLQEENYRMKDEITLAEGNTHRSVTRLLEKYEKYSSASKVLHRQHGTELEKAKADFFCTRDEATQEVQKIEEEVRAAGEQLKLLQHDLQVLRTYKDKEYPVKAMCIAKLQNSISNLSFDHKAEQHELERIINGERAHLSTERDSNTKAIVMEAAEDAYNACAPQTLQRLSQNNLVLQHEIQQNKQAIFELEKDLIVLKGEINGLKSKTETNFRKHVFPEAFQSTAKCSPDEEVLLDIPVQRILPI